ARFSPHTHTQPDGESGRELARDELAELGHMLRVGPDHLEDVDQLLIREREALRRHRDLRLEAHALPLLHVPSRQLGRRLLAGEVLLPGERRRRWRKEALASLISTRRSVAGCVVRTLLLLLLLRWDSIVGDELTQGHFHRPHVLLVALDHVRGEVLAP